MENISTKDQQVTRIDKKISIWKLILVRMPWLGYEAKRKREKFKEPDKAEKKHF